MMTTAPPTRSTDWMKASAAVVPLTVDQYHEMIRRGILPEGAPIELIDGFLVLKDRSKRGEDPMTVGVQHRWAVEALRNLDERVRGWDMHVASQQPVTLPTMHEPEPDASIVAGPLDNYRARTPAAADVLCVCEVSDSSLEYDRTTKQRLYATAGIPQYVIVNLVERVIELYAGPDPSTGRYARRRTVAPGQAVEIELRAGQVLTVQADQLLP
jgi:Uma2 family endonuclease